MKVRCEWHIYIYWDEDDQTMNEAFGYLAFMIWMYL